MQWSGYFVASIVIHIWLSTCTYLNGSSNDVLYIIFCISTVFHFGLTALASLNALSCKALMFSTKNEETPSDEICGYNHIQVK